MLHVPFAHSVDTMLYVLDDSIERLVSLQGHARHTTRIEETGDEVPMLAADQIAMAATLSNGARVSTHFRGGLVADNR